MFQYYLSIFRALCIANPIPNTPIANIGAQPTAHTALTFS